METNSTDFAIFIIWAGAHMSGIVSLGLLILWAAKNGQFRNLDRGRFLALDTEKKSRNLREHAE